jgi:hypothetical protein
MPARHRFRPAVERLETRTTPAHFSTTGALTAPALPNVLVGTPAQSAAIGQRMVAFLQSRLGVRLGGGECAHLASEALRVAGGQFFQISPDNPRPGDYVWGSLVTVISAQHGQVTDSNPSAPVLPGDIIQYRNAVFANHAVAEHHTSVVAAVGAGNLPTQVYQQNVGLALRSGTRTIRYTVRQRLNLKGLRAGWVRIYRPLPRLDIPGLYQFTLVNNTGSPVTVGTFAGGTPVFTLPLAKANTANSYTVAAVTTSGSARPTLGVSGTSVPIVNGGGYEVYTTQGGGQGIRRLSP